MDYSKNIYKLDVKGVIEEIDQAFAEMDYLINVGEVRFHDKTEHHMITMKVHELDDHIKELVKLLGIIYTNQEENREIAGRQLEKIRKMRRSMMGELPKPVRKDVEKDLKINRKGRAKLIKRRWK